MQEALSSADPTQSRDDYAIRVAPCGARLRVDFNGTQIADSNRALIVHETRLPPAYYFPPEDIRMDLLTKTDFHTHCPFKGNANYWTLAVEGHVAENAAWSYEAPYREAAAIRGHLSFYRNKITAFHDGNEDVPPRPENVDGMHGNLLANWLLKDAWKAATSADLVEQFFNFLRDSGHPIARGTVICPTLHPQIFATVFVWRADAPGIRAIHEPHDILHQPKFADSPFAPIIKGSGGVRRRLEDKDVALDFPVLRDLHEEGATDYVAMPFRFSDGQINVMSLTSFGKGGFGTSHLGKIYEVLPMLGRMLEVHEQRRTATALLEIYLGQGTGKRVLDGQVKHGDGEQIHAVIWFCDFRDSTPLSVSMGRQAYLRHLNRFFYCMAGAVLEAGGEVLRYIGDAVLAIFPIVDPAGDARKTATSASEACDHAIHAARIAAARVAAVIAEHPGLPPIRYGIGLHLGTVTYGNIGIPQRLEFTVIGAAANEAARIESMTKELATPLLISASFAASYTGRLASAGRHKLKGLEGEHELFALPKG